MLSGDAESVWRDVRALRHAPPGLAGQPGRREVFTAALEQAEQLLRGAAGLGHATRPLDLFYGLSQAGRALTAALVREGDWRLSGHGITPDGPLDVRLDQLRVREPKGGKGKPSRGPSFTTVARALGSPALPAPATLGALWAAVPESSHVPPLPGAEDEARALALEPVPVDEQLGPGTVTGAANAWAYGWSPYVGSPQPEEERRQLVRRLLDERYPSLAGAAFPEQAPLRVTVEDGVVSVLLVWELPAPAGDDSVRNDFVASLGGYYRGQLVLPPTQQGQDRPQHPLVTWWALLWALSMLARYEPDAWARHLDVDRSPYAVPLESLLDVALVAVPEALRDALAGSRGLPAR